MLVYILVWRLCCTSYVVASKYLVSTCLEVRIVSFRVRVEACCKARTKVDLRSHLPRRHDEGILGLVRIA